MSYTELDSVTWGSAPAIGVGFGYDQQRSGANMLYRVRITVAPVGGGSYFGYPIYADLSLDGDRLFSGVSLKAASPSTWAGAITWESGWMSICKTAGTTALTVHLYSGSGSGRSEEYRYTLPVSSYGGGGSSGGSSPTLADFSLSFGDLAIGESSVLTFIRPSARYTARVYYAFGGLEGEAELTAAATAAGRVSYAWTVPEALAARIPGSASGQGTLTLEIYRGSGLLGRKTYPFTALAGERFRPEASLAAQVVNDNAQLAAWGLCVQGLSRLSYTVTARGRGGAAITRYGFRFCGQALTDAAGTTAALSLAGEHTPSAVVTDTRGKSITVTAEKVTVYPYHPPVLRSGFAWRCDAEGNECEDGAYLRVQAAAECSPLDGRNRVSLRARCRPAGGSFGSYSALSSGTAAVLAGGLDPQTAYEVELSALDAVGQERTVLYTASGRQVTLHLREGGSGAAFGKYAQGDGLSCAWDAAFDGDVAVAGDLTLGGQLRWPGLSQALAEAVYPVGAIYLSAVSTHPAALCGGTWEAMEDRFLLCAGSGYAGGATGGSAAHTLSEAELPAHTHGFSGETDSRDLSHSHSVGADFDGAAGKGNYTVHSGGYPGSSINPATDTADLNHAHSFSGTTAPCGSGSAFSLLPPYLAVYAWRRIA